MMYIYMSNDDFVAESQPHIAVHHISKQDGARKPTSNNELKARHKTCGVFSVIVRALSLCKPSSFHKFFALTPIYELGSRS